MKNNFRKLNFEELLKNKLALVNHKFDKREGSIIWDALAPNSWETYLLLQELKIMEKEMFANTATRQYLIEHCKERGIKPRPASYGIYKGKFNLPVPIGARFGLKLINYTVIDVISEEQHTYKLQAETLGTVPNRNLGDLTPIDYIDGFKNGELTEILIHGGNEEDTESLRRRYLDSFNTISFGGNIKDYEEKVMAVSGVGAVKVTPVWRGGGTVKLTILNSEFGAATDTLLQKVKEIIDPSDLEGKGIGLAPIGHTVTVDTITTEVIDISTSILTKNELTEEDKEAIVKNIKLYFKNVINNWLTETQQYIRIQKIEYAISKSIEYIDMRSTKINGKEINYLLKENKLPILGEIKYEIF